MMLNLIFLVALAACALGNAHTVITYPGWRGNNLIVNETFPYGMQWAYPCKLSLVSIYHHHEGFFSAFCHETLADILGGGLSTSTNRTKWPVTGGAVAVQPGWFQGHSKALMYINLGLGTDGPYEALQMYLCQWRSLKSWGHQTIPTQALSACLKSHCQQMQM
jgi:hypothetical protein